MGHLLCSKLVLAFVLNFYDVTLQRYFSHPSLVIPNLTRNTKTGTANRWGGKGGKNWKTTNSKPPGPIIMVAQSRAGSCEVRSYLLHSSLAGVRLDCVFLHTNLSKLYENAGPSPFCRAKPACFDFSSSNFTLQGPHITEHWTGWTSPCTPQPSPLHTPKSSIEQQ
jgi:hypothetical protein